MFVHATCVALRSRRAWRAVLLRGPSGAGKSDLALRLIADGARLVADDQTHLALQSRRLMATPPPALAGRLEVRGLGIVRLTKAQLLGRAPVALVVDLVPAGEIERLPEPQQVALQGIELPLLALAGLEPSAVAKLRLAFARIADA